MSETESSGNSGQLKTKAGNSVIALLRKTAPAWHDRPTGPGCWVAYGGDGRRLVDVTQQQIDDGVEHSGFSFFGPIPADPKGA